MKFEAIEGKFNKIFIKITIDHPNDKEFLKIVKKCLWREEYKPFMKGFNKTISYSYLYEDQYFPSSFWEDVKDKYIKVYNVSPQLINEQLLYDNITDFDDWLESLRLPPKYIIGEKDDRDYTFQIDAVKAALKNRVARIEIGTSGGKTLITYIYCRYLIEHNTNIKIIILVPNKSLCIQLSNDFDDYQSLRDDKINVETIYAASKKVDNANIIVGTYHSLREYDAEYFDDFKIVICDEAHTSKAYSIKQGIFQKIKNATHFFGMSGTYPDYKTLDYLHITSMFGSLVYQKSTMSLIQDNVSVPLKIHRIIVNYKDETVSSISTTLKESGVIGIDKYRDEKHFVQTYIPRINLVMKLLSGVPGNSLVLVDTIEYAQLLFDTLKLESQSLITGQQSVSKLVKGYGTEIDVFKETREQIYDRMRESHKHIIVATFATMSTGISINNLTNIFIPDGGKSFIRIRQSIGRSLRLHPDKTEAEIFDFQDNIKGSSFKNHAYARNKIYKEQNFPVVEHMVTI
jgi:superfamily II DNA or RNA helicase